MCKIESLERSLSKGTRRHRPAFATTVDRMLKYFAFPKEGWKRLLDSAAAQSNAERNRSSLSPIRAPAWR